LKLVISKKKQIPRPRRPRNDTTATRADPCQSVASHASPELGERVAIHAEWAGNSEARERGRFIGVRSGGTVRVRPTGSATAETAPARALTFPHISIRWLFRIAPGEKDSEILKPRGEFKLVAGSRARARFEHSSSCQKSFIVRREFRCRLPLRSGDGSAARQLRAHAMDRSTGSARRNRRR
jgi:hypothetical protein